MLCVNTTNRTQTLKQMRLGAEQSGVTTQAQLARTLGVDEVLILKWETDENLIPLGYYKKWQLACGIRQVSPMLTSTRITRIRKSA